MKRLTEAVGEHWKAMIHVAIGEAAQQRPLPYFGKAMVEIEIITPRGNDNARLWDTSNRAIQAVLNNLKDIFFEDANPLFARTPYRMSVRKVITNIICCNFWVLNKL